MTDGAHTLRAEVVVPGAGLAGLVTAFELLDRKVLLLDKDRPGKIGGLAKESFGGVCMIDTPHQRRLGLRDSPDLAWRDWQTFAKFESGDEWPRRWARLYCDGSREYVFDFPHRKGVSFLPLVNWPERGLDEPGNTVPRWHIAWGIGYEIVDRVVRALDAHPRRDNLTRLFDHEVSDIVVGRAMGVRRKSMRDGAEYEARVEHVVVASGGICGGDLGMVRRHWYASWGDPPKALLNGAHDYGDGMLHERVRALGGSVTHLDKQWHY